MNQADLDQMKKEFSKSGGSVKNIPVGKSVHVGPESLKEICKKPGCKRFAVTNGYCRIHWAQRVDAKKRFGD